jgi:translocation and assembly module TamA
VGQAQAAILAALAISLLAPAAALAAEPKALVQGDFDKALKTEIQRAIGVVKTHPESRIDARRRAREASEAAISVLRSEGYYDYEVEADVGEGDTPDAIVRITPGPRSTLGPSQIVWDGAAPDAVAAAAAQTALDLKVGAPGRTADVVAAEGRVAAVLRNRGYADATVRPRHVVVDHADHTLQPTFHFASGSLVRLGEVKVVGKSRPGRKATSTIPPRSPNSSSACAMLACSTR